MCKSYMHLQYVPIEQNAHVQRRLEPLASACPLQKCPSMRLEVQERVKRDRGGGDNHSTKGYMHLPMATIDPSQLWRVSWKSGRGEKKKRQFACQFICWLVSIRTGFDERWSNKTRKDGEWQQSFCFLLTPAEHPPKEAPVWFSTQNKKCRNHTSHIENFCF